MAFYPAHCDNKCDGCEKNRSEWCIWKDKPTSKYSASNYVIKSIQESVSDVTYPHYNILMKTSNEEKCKRTSI